MCQYSALITSLDYITYQMYYEQVIWRKISKCYPDIKAYPDASCNLQMPLTDFCLRATIATGSSDWLLGPHSVATSNGQAQIPGKSAALTASDLPLVFPHSLFPSEIISLGSLAVPAPDQMSSTHTPTFPRHYWLIGPQSGLPLVH